VKSARPNPWLNRFALLTALATLGLIGLGGLVTSKEAGMSVPDWPTSYGYNMFALPFKFWSGGVFYEHTHRLWASTVGLLVVVLVRWLGGGAARRPLLIVGAAEILAGIGIFVFFPGLKATGHFLTGIGGVVFLAGLVWVKSEAASRTLVKLGWAAFWLVQFQGLLGGLRVVLFRDQIGILHAALAQIFFVLTGVIALFTSRWWRERENFSPTPEIPRSLRRHLHFTTGLIFIQLLLGATMRHQHAGLAIRDFPLAYGKLWPATDPAALATYNQARLEITNVNPITAFQIQLQMVHRLAALLILAAVGFCAWQARRTASLRLLTLGWLGLILGQVALGAATVLTDKAADLATAHVLVGALSLATGAMLCIISARQPGKSARATGIVPAGELNSRDQISFAARTSAP